MTGSEWLFSPDEPVPADWARMTDRDHRTYLWARILLDADYASGRYTAAQMQARERAVWRGWRAVVALGLGADGLPEFPDDTGNYGLDPPLGVRFQMLGGVGISKPPTLGRWGPGSGPLGIQPGAGQQERVGQVVPLGGHVKEGPDGVAGGDGGVQEA